MRDGKKLQKEANKMLMQSLANGTALPDNYIKIRREAEDALHMWDFQTFEKQRYGRLQSTFPSSRRTFYRVIRDWKGKETTVIGQGGNVGYLPRVCQDCSCLPAGSAECIHYACTE